MVHSDEFVRLDEPTPGLQRLAARFTGHAYDRHRHETYAIGLTLSGVQAFWYRGEMRASVAGQSLIIHPDELHDGHAGDQNCFSYGMIYVEPWLVRRALPDGAALPFVREVVAWDTCLAQIIRRAFSCHPEMLGTLETDDVIAMLADLLVLREGQSFVRANHCKASKEVAIARDLLNAATHRMVQSSELERATGIDRFALARAFRSIIGTSPSRYHLGRRLAGARSRIAAGETLSAVAASLGFADQSHLTRHFKQRFGLTPGTFARLSRA